MRVCPREGQVMGHQNDGGAAAGCRCDGSGQPVQAMGVQRDRGFVQGKHCRLAGQDSGQRQQALT